MIGNHRVGKDYQSRPVEKITDGKSGRLRQHRRRLGPCKASRSQEFGSEFKEVIPELMKVAMSTLAQIASNAGLIIDGVGSNDHPLRRDIGTEGDYQP